MNEKPRVCFYGLYCYPLFNPDYSFLVGGTETRVTLIAKELAKRGKFDVSMIVADYGQPHVENREEVQLISWIGKKGGTPAEDNSGDDEIHTSSQINITSENQQEEIPRQKSQEQRQYKFVDRSLKYQAYGRNMSKKIRAIGKFLVDKFLEIVDYFHSDCLDGFKNRSEKGLIEVSILALTRVSSMLKDAIFIASNVLDTLDQNGFYIVWRDDVDILDEIDADIYVVPGNHRTSAIVAHYCKLHNKGYIFLAGSDYDYRPEYKMNPNGFDIYGEPNFLKTYAIEQATFHIVQTPRQANLLRQGYGRGSTVIRNPTNLNTDYPRSTTPETILWVGKADERIKRPSIIFELARCLPNQPFVVILNKAFSDVYSLCQETARNLPNVTLIESVPFDQVERFFADARLFVNTSAFEGFPNTFLQAAKYSVPIIATDVDPGGMLSQHGCGITCSGDFERLVDSVQQMLTDDDLYAKTSAAAIKYMRRYHDKEIVIPQYEKAFQEVLENITGYARRYDNKLQTN